MLPIRGHYTFVSFAASEADAGRLLWPVVIMQTVAMTRVLSLSLSLSPFLSGQPHNILVYRRTVLVVRRPL